MSRWAPTRRRLVAVAGAFSMLATMAIAATPAAAVNADQGKNVVSTNPADFTPHVMNGSVNAIVQLGNNIYAAGTFTTVRQTVTGPNLTRNRMFSFNATTGVINAGFNPNLGGAVNSLDTDGSFVYAGGSFGSVGGNSAIKRVVKLTAAGAVVTGFNAVPNSGVNEVVVRGSRLYVGGGFTSVKSGPTTTPRRALAALDAATGAVLPAVNVPFTGLYDPALGGTTNIKRFDVTPDGSRLVAVGNFSAVGGEPRSQLALLNTTGTAANVASWATNRYDADHNDCAGVFDTFMRDVDFSPDGSYFAVTATGAYAGGIDSGTLCDTTTRWETDSTGNDPTWADYTGGDTTYGVAVTGAAIYTGGHMRWQNNPFQGDEAGPGAVPREGISALDPVNGLPLSWNPGRSRGVGAQALYATSTGLWVGSDTDKIGQPRETHSRIAFMPLAGGTTLPTVANATLPNDMFLAERPAAGNTNVLYRVNAAGPPVQASDSGPDWSSDTGYVSGGNTADWGTSVPFDTTIPAGTSPAIFSTERWGAMNWSFPVPAGKSIVLRLYFTNQYDGTAQVGQRVFDVNIDGGALELGNFDIVAAAGANKLATMKSFSVVSDGAVDIDFSNVVENPLVNGIEIIDSSAGAPTATPGRLFRRAVDASGRPTAPATTANTTIDWSLVRGAFLQNGTLFYGLGDGGLYSRPFNNVAGVVGNATTVNLFDDPDDGARIPFAIANLTGIFYDTSQHRLYYTLFNDSTLHYRYFTPESQVVGAQTFVANNGGVDLSSVSGMTFANGSIFYGSSLDGFLRSVPFGSSGITGSPATVNTDGSWRSRAMFVPNN